MPMTRHFIVPLGSRIVEVVHVKGKRHVNVVTSKGKPQTVVQDRG